MQKVGPGSPFTCLPTERALFKHNSVSHGRWTARAELSISLSSSWTPIGEMNPSGSELASSQGFLQALWKPLVWVRDQLCPLMGHCDPVTEQCFYFKFQPFSSWLPFSLATPPSLPLPPDKHPMPHSGCEFLLTSL